VKNVFEDEKIGDKGFYTNKDIKRKGFFLYKVKGILL